MKILWVLALAGGMVAYADGEIRSPACQFMKVQAHENPAALVDDFLQKDFNGQFLTSTQWLNSAELCPGNEPSLDSSIVTRSFEVKSAPGEDGSVDFEVTYEVLGRLEQSVAGGKSMVTFTPHNSQEVRKLSAVKTPFGWRLKGILLAEGSHVSPKAALGYVDGLGKDKTLQAADRAQLEKLLGH